MNKTPSSPSSALPETGLGYRIAARTAVVAAVFSLLVSALLLYDYTRRRMKDPFEAQAFLVLKSAINQQPKNEELRKQLAVLDRELNEEYQRQREFAWMGAVLLAGGVAVFLVAAGTAAALGRKVPMPQPPVGPEDSESRWTPVARWTVAGMGILLAGGAIGLNLALRSPLAKDLEDRIAIAGTHDEPQQPVAPPAAENPAKTLDEAPTKKEIAKPTPPAAAPGYVPSAAEIQAAWSRFRGPDGSGISPYANVPETWDVPSGKNIVWKTPVPLPGHNSPIVCGKRVFLSGANEKTHQVYCFDTADGKLLWQRDVPITPQGTPAADKEWELSAETGYAASTLATDGKHVFAIFANGDVAAVDFNGNLAWSLGLGLPDNGYGHAASLLTYKNLLIVPLDQGTGKDGKSKLLALDTASGKTVWQQGRAVASSWTTPIVIQHAGRDQLITAANPWIIAYDPNDGKELWRAKGLSGDVAPSPVFADGVVYVVPNDYGKLLAVRVDGQGDVTATHVLWQGEDNLPDTCSPLATKEYVYLLTTSAMLTCYDAKKGNMLWDKDLGKLKFNSSPGLAGNRLYLIGDLTQRASPSSPEVHKAKALVFEPGKDGCKQIAEANLGEACVTSPAFQDGRIYLRGEKHLICIGNGN